MDKFFGTFLLISGFLMIANLDGYYDAAGVFIMIWGNNVEKSTKF